MIQGKYALVTGAASGIGKAVAEMLGREGAHVYRADVQGDGMRLDVTREEDWIQAMAQMERVDIYVHSAGIATAAAVEACELDEWERTLRVNLTGAFLGLKHVLPVMRRNPEGGSVVLIGSASGTKAAAGAAAYCVSKAGLAMLARVAALEAKEAGVRVNVLSPAGVVTPMWKELPPEEANLTRPALERMASVEEVAEVVRFLASEGSKGMTGTELRYDAGYTL